MSPLEVVVVQRKPTAAALVGRLIGSVVLAPFLTAWALMLLVPVLHETAGTPDRHPGYWLSVVVVFLARVVVQGFRETRVPQFLLERTS